MSVKLARALADLGASPEVIAVAVEAVTLASRDGDVTRHGVPRDPKAADRARRYRKSLKHKRKTEGAKANDVATTVTPASRDASRHATDAPLLSSFLSLNSEGLSEEGSKSSKKARSENARARGQRMITGAILTDEWLQAAIELGAAPSQIPEMWAEHVDYWIGVPGARGVKLDWLATWRNDVRRKLKMGNRNGTAKQSLSDRARDLAEQARSAERARGLI
jgi:hypothetical protein